MKLNQIEGVSSIWYSEHVMLTLALHVMITIKLITQKYTLDFVFFIITDRDTVSSTTELHIGMQYYLL